jgi:hypothetical protein
VEVHGAGGDAGCEEVVLDLLVGGDEAEHQGAVDELVGVDVGVEPVVDPGLDLFEVLGGPSRRSW